MTDLLYVLLTLAFFGTMLAYVRGCEHLGQHSSSEGGNGKEQPK